MDPLSQGLLGGLVAPLVAKPKNLRIAFAVGFISALLADLDVLIRSSEDPLLSLEYHRHFTHSLIFVPVGGFLGAVLTRILSQKKLSFKESYIFAFLGYLTAAPLDACTSYGTHLFWPFSGERTAWHIISIIDPIFTGVILILTLFALAIRSKRLILTACTFSVLYLGLGAAQREKAETIAYELANKRGHIAKRLSVKPSIGNILLWRSVYQNQENYMVDAILIKPFKNSKVFEGGSAPVVNIENEFNDIPANSILKKDIKRFAFFSDYYLALHPQDPAVLGDLRYAMLPNSLEPLWGIQIDRSKLNKHVKWINFRQNSSEKFKKLKAMLLY